MKKTQGIRDIYRSIRKPLPSPTRQEQDRRDDIRRKDARREINGYRGSRESSGGQDDT